ncbi:hypothetical protein G6F63_014199 [Rhizopus arrhizus]|nr:hypothetical protein G6F39_013885 [Rhizopus arrhizus]KAG1320557.1 hypothetical protein G6F63_014199 [Rhizopus arrhizus]
MGHSRKDCPELPAETRTCYVCNSRGHIARNCPKTDENDQSSSKRARGAQSVGITPTVISRKSKKRGRQPAATPMLASTTPAPLIIEAEPSPPLSTQSSSASISTTEVDSSSTSFSLYTDNSSTQIDEDDNDRMDTDTNPDATEHESADNAVLSPMLPKQLQRLEHTIHLLNAVFPTGRPKDKQDRSSLIHNTRH